MYFITRRVGEARRAFSNNFGLHSRLKSDTVKKMRQLNQKDISDAKKLLSECKKNSALWENYSSIIKQASEEDFKAQRNRLSLMNKLRTNEARLKLEESYHKQRLNEIQDDFDMGMEMSLNESNFDDFSPSSHIQDISNMSSEMHDMSSMNLEI